MITPRDYQFSCIDAVRDAFRRFLAVLMVLPTGGGKTVIFSYIAMRAAKNGKRVLILAHRDTLIKQASRKLNDYGVPHGIIMAGFTPAPRRLVQVASVQTLVRRIEKMKARGESFDMIVIDECLRGDALIDTDIGTIKIEDVPTSGACSVRSFDGSKDVWMPIEAFADKGVRDTLLVKHAAGEIVCTNNHLFYTKSGWKRADQLTPTDCLFVSAVAANRPPSINGGIQANGYLGTESTHAKTWTGMLGSLLSWLLGQSARVDAGSSSTRNIVAPRKCGLSAQPAAATTSSCLVTSAVVKGSRTKSVISSVRQFLVRFLGMRVFYSPMENQSTRDFHGITAQNKQTGLLIRQNFLKGSLFASALLKIKATGLSLSTELRPAIQSCWKFICAATRMGKSTLLASGSTTLEPSDLRGGTATTATTIRRQERPFSTSKASSQSNKKSFGIGSMQGSEASFSKLAHAGFALFASTLVRLKGCLTKSGAMSRECSPTRWVPVLSVSAESACRVFDIQVAQTHCFYANDVLVHNCHLSAAASYMKIREAFPSALVLGVTGSPIRLDGKGLGANSGGMFQEIVVGVTVRQLIDNGYLVQPTVYASREQIDLAGIKKVAGDYDNEALADVMDKPKITGNAIEHWKRICPGVPAAVWCVNVAHAQHVAAEFNAAGIPSLALSGESTSEERDRATRDLESGKLKVVTSAMLLVEGWDCPSIGAIILLRPTMSLASYLQFIGRGLRTLYAPGMPLDTVEQRFAAIDAGPKGRKCFVLDHCGLTFKHGFADQEREWSLEGVVKGKSKKKEQEPKLDLLQCPRCYHVHDPAPECPACGHIYEVKVRKVDYAEGQLEEITPEMRAAMDERMKNLRRAEVRGAKTLEELERIAAQRGYSHGWAKATFTAKARAREKYRGSSRP